ncbi:hypothetical protein ASF14_01435 [Sphingomonas sp. Leaf257]|nr:hypothetical protein ASF14_01435 [Sphingomonas sp. Leaf257]
MPPRGLRVARDASGAVQSEKLGLGTTENGAGIVDIAQPSRPVLSDHPIDVRWHEEACGSDRQQYRLSVFVDYVKRPTARAEQGECTVLVLEPHGGR